MPKVSIASDAFAEEVGEQADAGGPADAAERVPEEERAPAHRRRARDPGGPRAQTEHEAAEEHRLGAVPFEEGLAGGEHLPPLALEAPGALEQPATAATTDLVAEVVADDRGKRRHRDHELDLQLAAAGERPAAISAVSPGTGTPGDSAITRTKSSG